MEFNYGILTILKSLVGRKGGRSLNSLRTGEERNFIRWFIRDVSDKAGIGSWGILTMSETASGPQKALPLCHIKIYLILNLYYHNFTFRLHRLCIQCSPVSFSTLPLVTCGKGGTTAWKATLCSQLIFEWTGSFSGFSILYWNLLENGLQKCLINHISNT